MILFPASTFHKDIPLRGILLKKQAIPLKQDLQTIMIWVGAPYPILIDMGQFVDNDGRDKIFPFVQEENQFFIEIMLNRFNLKNTKIARLLKDFSSMKNNGFIRIRMEKAFLYPFDFLVDLALESV